MARGKERFGFISEMRKHRLRKGRKDIKGDRGERDSGKERKDVDDKLNIEFQSTMKKKKNEK